jgi:hypothetical protein
MGFNSAFKGLMYGFVQSYPRQSMQVGAQIHTTAPEVQVKGPSVSFEQESEWVSKQPEWSEEENNLLL